MESIVFLKFTRADLVLGSFPRTMEQIQATALLLLGALFGWISHPLLWFAFGPFRWLSLIKATAVQESLYDPNAVVVITNDDGEVIEASVGILQYNSLSPTLPNDNVFSPSTTPGEMFAFDVRQRRELDWRFSPWWSGYYAATYYSVVLARSPAWWSMVLPVYGIAVARVAWVGGTSEIHANATWFSFADTWDRGWTSQPLFGRAYMTCRAAWFVLVQLPLVLLAGARAR